MNQKLRKYHSLARVLTDVLLFVFMALTGLSGIVMWIAGKGPRVGYGTLLFNLTRFQWGQFHTFVSLTTLIFAFLHVILEYKILVVLLKSVKKTLAKD